MKKIFSFAIACLACLSGQAQLTVRDIFAAAPDSIFPLMTQNNRLDCLDFKENNMQARVRNLLDTYTEMTDLTPFYLRIQMTERSTAQLRLLSASDSIFCLINTYWGPNPDSHIAPVFIFILRELHAKTPCCITFLFYKSGCLLNISIRIPSNSAT